MKKATRSRLNDAILETAPDMHRLGILDDASYEKITLRHLGENPVAAAQPMTGDEIRKLRERANLSQAVFARYLHLTPGYVSQLERGVKHPSGPALVLLDVIRRKGIEGIL